MFDTSQKKHLATNDQAYRSNLSYTLEEIQKEQREKYRNLVWLLFFSSSDQKELNVFARRDTAKLVGKIP